MPTISHQGRRDSSSRPEATAGLPIRPPVQPPGIRQPACVRPASNMRLAHVPSRLTTSHRSHHNRVSDRGKSRDQYYPATQGADFGPPNVPVQSVGRRPKRSAHFPLRNISRQPPSPNSILEWKRKWRTTSSGTRMNPEASTFAPKPTYAQTVKTALPYGSVSDGQEVRLIGKTSHCEARDSLPTDLSTENIFTAHRGISKTEGRAALVGGTSQDSGIVRRHSASRPNTTVTMDGRKSQKGPEALSNRSQSSANQRASANMSAYDWYDEHHPYQHPMSFRNPLLGPYVPHPPIPGHEHLSPVYKCPSPMLQATPIPWDPAVAAAWDHFHRSQSAQAIYGPFHPPPMPHPDMQHTAYITQQPMPPFAPFASWNSGHPHSLQDTTGSAETQTESFSPPPAPTKKIPSRGKLHQMVREAQRAKRHREHSQARAEAWRAQNETDRPPQPLFREREYSQTLPAPAHAHPRTEPRHEPPCFGVSPAPLSEHERLRPTVGSEQQGRTQYRLVSAKPTTRYDGSSRQKHRQRADEVRETSPESTSNDSALMFGEDKVDTRDLAHLASQTSEDNPKSSTTIKADGPPPNAPTGPASLRRFANLQHHRTSLIQKPAEQGQGSWSQSKRWVSQETKERAAFQKLMHTLRYMGVDSPFLPQTPSELTKFKIAQADRKSKKMNEQLARMEDRRYRRRKAQHEGVDESAPEILGGKKMADNLSPVFAQESCFNKMPPPEGLTVDWPCRAEMKEEGDKRAARYGRYFPLPRLNSIAPRILEDSSEGESPYNDDGTISWEKKAVKHMSRFIRPVTSELEPFIEEEPKQLEMHELHHWLNELLGEIDAFD